MKYDEIRFEVWKIDTKFVHAMIEHELDEIKLVNPDRIKSKVECYKVGSEKYYHKESVVKAIFDILNDKVSG